LYLQLFDFRRHTWECPVVWAAKHPQAVRPFILPVPRTLYPDAHRDMTRHRYTRDAVAPFLVSLPDIPRSRSFSGRDQKKKLGKGGCSSHPGSPGFKFAIARQSPFPFSGRKYGRASTFLWTRHRLRLRIIAPKYLAVFQKFIIFGRTTTCRFIG
jgi:hypothetical protein